MRHLEVLRGLLARDYLSRADWRFALHDLARMAQEALSASEAFVVTFDGDGAGFSAFGSDGRVLGADELSPHGSRSAVEFVRAKERPLLTTLGRDPLIASESARQLGIESVLVVPIFFWDAATEAPNRRLGGCVYAHRTAATGRFGDEDVELILDLTRIAQPILNLLLHLTDVKRELAASKERLEEMTRLAGRLGAFETNDPAFAKGAVETLRRVAAADKVGLLILGPTGSGKTHAARAYHEACARRAGPFVTLDGAQATSPETLAAELFGYAPSSGYANAPPKGRPGKAQLADGGTLFIDEVAVLPPELQQRLLRLVQEGRFSPLGSAEEVLVDVQVLAATNTDLPELVRTGRFREDLYWRLGEVTVRLPPLDERRADIASLAARFLADARARYKREEVAGFSEAAMAALVAHPWSRSGNIRGLMQTVNRAVLLAPPGTRELSAADVAPEELGGAPAPKSDGAELETVKSAIRAHGSGTAAARSLGMTRDALVWRLRKAGLTIEDVLGSPERREAN